MKRVYIVHGWDGTPTEPQISWIRHQLETEGFVATALTMPHTEAPVMGEWVATLKKEVIAPDRQTYFIGHSIGCQAIMRYIADLPSKVQIGGAIFLAGWFVLNSMEDEGSEKIAKPWVDTPIDFESLRNRTGNYVAILSDNDRWVPVEVTKQQFEEKLSAKVLIAHNQGHFTADDGVTEIPVVIEELKRISAET